MQLWVFMVLTCLSAASIAAIAGLGLAASKVDAGFSEWLNDSGAFVRVRHGVTGNGAREGALCRRTGVLVVG